MRELIKKMLYRLGILMVGMSKHGEGVVKQLGNKGVSQFKAEKINAFIEGVEIEEEGLWLAQEDINRYCEQYMYRLLVCPGCRREDGCPHCECSFPIKMQTPSTSCEIGEWGKMLGEKEWQDYKNENKIYFTLHEKTWRVNTNTTNTT
jgi:hypothetical protein